MGRARESIWAMGIATLGLALFWGFGPLDDDYIVYRYAQRWIEFGQLAYNNDQFVEGFSTPLWLFWITAALKLGLAPDLASQFLGVAASLGCALLVVRLWARTRGERLAWPAFLVAGLPAMAFHALGGLGTVPLALLILAWANSWQAARAAGRAPWLAALWLGLACLMRAECALIAPCFLWAEWRANGSFKRALGLAWPALLLLALWSLFRWRYFGEWLPNTYYTKRLPLEVDLAYGLSYLWSSTLNSGVGLWLCMLLPLAWMRSVDGLQRCLAQVVLLHAAYVIHVGGDYIDMARFFVPMLPLMIFLAGCRIDALLVNRPRRLGLVALLCGLALLWPYTQLSFKKEVYRNNEGRWKLVGRELARSFPDHLRVVLSPIGCVGYLSKLPIVDPLGLTQRDLRDLPPDLTVTLKGHQRHDADWVFAQLPEVFIPSNARLVPNTRFISFTWELDLLQHPALAQNYRLLSSPVPDSYPLVYYLRNDIPMPPGASPLTPG